MDDKYANAIDAVAKHAINKASAECLGDDWADGWDEYPDLGEYDWEQVKARVHDILGLLMPDADTFQAAYDYLSERAHDG